MATLAEPPELDDLVRFDFTSDAWRDGARPPASYRFVAMWRPVASEGGSDRRGMVSEEDLLALFEGMDAPEQGRAAAFRYLLALLLLRKRLFRVVDQRVGEHGRPVLQIARRGAPRGIEPEIVEVIDPGMDEAAIAAGIEELSAVIGGSADESARGAE